jgi:hypothetical protein
MRDDKAQNEKREQRSWEGGDSARMVMVRAATMFQAQLRRIRARKQLVLQMQDQECLLARPDTVQGKSGWYEYDEDGEAMVARFNVAEDADGQKEWGLVKGPMKLANYTEALLLKREVGAKRSFQPESDTPPPSQRDSAAATRVSTSYHSEGEEKAEEKIA